MKTDLGREMGFVGGNQVRCVRVGLGRRICARSIAVIVQTRAVAASMDANGETRSADEGLSKAMRLALSGIDDDERAALLLTRELSPRDALEVLEALLENSANDIIKATAAAMIGQTGRRDDALEPRCVRILTMTLTSEQEDVGVRSAAAAGLGDLRGDRSLEALRRAFYEETEWTVTYGILAAFGNLGDSRAVPMLCEVLSSPVSMIVQRAVTSLGEIRDPAAVPHLLSMETPMDELTSMSLAQALGSFTQFPEVVERLEAMARSDDVLASLAAEEALAVRSEPVGNRSNNAEDGERDDDEATPTAPAFTLREQLERTFQLSTGGSSGTPADGTEPLADPTPADLAEATELSPSRQAEYTELCEQLKAASPEDKAIAAIRLRSFPDGLKEAAVKYADALRDPSQRVRASVLNLVSRNPNTLAAVLLGDPDQNVRASACASLVECGVTEVGVQATVTAFENDADWIVRVAAAIALGTYATGDERAYESLLRALAGCTDRPTGPERVSGVEGTDASVIAGHVITSLGFVGRADVLPRLAELAACADPRLRERTAAALGFVMHPRSLDILDGLVADKDASVREAAHKSQQRLRHMGV